MLVFPLCSSFVLCLFAYLLRCSNTIHRRQVVVVCFLFYFCLFVLVFIKMLPCVYFTLHSHLRFLKSVPGRLIYWSVFIHASAVSPPSPQRLTNFTILLPHQFQQSHQPPPPASGPDREIYLVTAHSSAIFLKSQSGKLMITNLLQFIIRQRP